MENGSHFPKRGLKIAIWEFGEVKIKTWVFLGFPKTFPTSIPITSTLRVPPPPPMCFKTVFYINVFVTKLDLSSVNIFVGITKLSGVNQI